MAPSLELQEKITRLIKAILTHYQNLETSQTQSNPTKYYVHNEFDSNVTEFEGLSNSRRIVLATPLDINHAHVLMRIFQCVYDSNYWVFEDIESISDPDDISPEGLIGLLLYSDTNPNPWIEYLEKAYEDSDNSTYDSVPSVDSSYYHSTKRQKIYTIQDIIKLVEKN